MTGLVRLAGYLLVVALLCVGGICITRTINMEGSNDSWVLFFQHKIPQYQSGGIGNKVRRLTVLYPDFLHCCLYQD